MKLFSTVIALFSVAVCADGLKLKAADGDNVTIPFKNAGLERAEQVTVTLTRESQETVIARYCRCAHCGDCSVVETQGVLLRVEEGTVTLLHVSSNNSGLYVAKIIADNNLFKKNATLDVNKPPISSRTDPTQSSISKPPNSSERQRLYGLIAPVLFILVVLGIYVFCKCRNVSQQLMLKQPDELLLSPARSCLPSTFQHNFTAIEANADIPENKRQSVISDLD